MRSLPVMLLVPGQRRVGFTLVELLVVIAIIGILVALLLPAIQAAREAARRSQCKNNLKQIGLALQNHLDARKSFPMGCLEWRTTGNAKLRQWAWSAKILPYLEEQTLYQQIDFQQPYDAAINKTAVSTVLTVFQCPQVCEPN